MPRPLDDLRLALGRAGLLTIVRFLVSSVICGQRSVSRIEGRGGLFLLPEKIRSQVYRVVSVELVVEEDAEVMSEYIQVLGRS